MRKACWTVRSPYLQALLECPRIDLAWNSDQLKIWAEELEHFLGLFMLQDGDAFTAQVAGDGSSVIVTLVRSGISKTQVFNQEWLASQEYRRIERLRSQTCGLIEEGAHVKRGERTFEVDCFSGAMDWLLKEGRTRVEIQRYKGLGEMNAEQLWETTMDPESRRMLKVALDDVGSVEEILTTLMGKEIEPRREFIQTNALDVVNLDV